MLLVIPKNKQTQKMFNIFEKDDKIYLLPSFIQNIYFKENIDLAKFVICEDVEGSLYKVELDSIFDTLGIGVEKNENIYTFNQDYTLLVDIKKEELCKIHTKPIITDLIVKDKKDANRLFAGLHYININPNQYNDLIEELKFLYNNAIQCNCSFTVKMDSGERYSYSTVQKLILTLQEGKCDSILINILTFYFNNGCGKKLYKKVNNISEKYNASTLEMNFYKKTKTYKMVRKLSSLEQSISKLNK
ncbi:hypothetical protein [Romboutsia ilealis]|nr:hypothetical protein [Romboutsia ilealis]